MEMKIIKNEEGLMVNPFMDDLRKVFEKHEIEYVKDGYVGFNEKGQFQITDSKIQGKNEF